MIKFFFIILAFIFVNSCSFDDKSGIWKNEKIISKNESDPFKKFEDLSVANKPFNQIIKFKGNFQFKKSKKIINSKWKDIFYSESNNLENFTYKNTNKLTFKSKKITRHQLNDFILFDNDKIISSDNKGNILIFSIEEKKFLKKFNFYKNKYKNINKHLNLILDNNKIFVSDNLGYLYAINLVNNEVLWAKNYKVPFRSNIKISDEKLILSNQNNFLFFFDKNTGNLLREIPTEETVLKNEFQNNLSLNQEKLFFLNTYGSLYAINLTNMKILWFLNLNQSVDINPSSLFKGNQVINYKNNVIVSSNQSLYILDTNTGRILFKKNFTSQLKPLIYNDVLFLISKNDLLISMNLITGEILYSYNINQLIADFLNLKKKKAQFKSLMIANDKIFIFLNNSFLLKFKINGDLEEISKLPSKINTQPIFINSSMLYLDKKNKISIID